MSSGLWLGLALGRAGRGRPRQADLRHRPAAAVLRALGRAAHRRVDRQAGQGHPAGGRRAAGRARRLRRRPHLPAPAPRRRARRGDRRQGRGAARGRPPGDRARDRRPRRPRADLLLRRVRDRHRRAGCWASTRSTSPTCRRPRTPPAACSPRAPRTSPTPTDDELRALLGGLGAPSYLAVMGYVEPSADFDAAVSELRQVDPRRDAVGDDVRLRAALPALDRPAAQGRPADRALPAAVHDSAPDVDIPDARLRLHAPQARAGDRRPRDAARARPARASA